jgi:AcrR family transcriptional regulator
MTPANTAVRPAQRKRGVALEDAILEAAYAEFTEVGYSQFTVEAVAARARTGKASIYRRWPTKQALVLDSLCAGLPTAQQCGFEESYGDMTTADALREVARAINRVLTSPAGDAIRAVKLEAVTDSVLAKEVDERFHAPRRAAMLNLLQRGVERGEVRPEAVDPLVADVLPAVLSFQVIMQRQRITEVDIVAIIEQVMIPLVEAR